MLNIVFEDNWFIVINKPSGMLVIPTLKNEKNTLTDILNQELQSRGLSIKAHPCHRLDRETSGLIIYAKGKTAQEKMMKEFHKKAVKKRYLALVHGAPKYQEETIKNYLSKPGSSKPYLAITTYKVLRKYPKYSLLEIWPITGRTNQIRLHMKQIGHPVVGERKFAFGRDFALKSSHLCLHSKEITFSHPFTNKVINLSCKLPSYIQDFLK